MRKRRCHLLLLMFTLCACACASHFGARRIDRSDLYTARSFLVGGETEQAGYGLYSYLLFPEPPTPASRGRYEAAVRAFLAYPPSAAAESLLPHETINIFYLLLMDAPESKVERCLESNCYPVEDALVTSILSRYNYVRANIILRKVLHENHSGPFIATFTKPVSTMAISPAENADGEVLLQDLSRAPSHLVRSWVTLFIEEATGEGSAFNHNLNALMLHLRAALDAYADGLPAVFDACMKCMVLKKGTL